MQPLQSAAQARQTIELQQVLVSLCVEELTESVGGIFAVDLAVTGNAAARRRIEQGPGRV